MIKNKNSSNQIIIYKLSNNDINPRSHFIPVVLDGTLSVVVDDEATMESLLVAIVEDSTTVTDCDYVEPITAFALLSKENRKKYSQEGKGKMSKNGIE